MNLALFPFGPPPPTINSEKSNSEKIGHSIDTFPP